MEAWLKQWPEYYQVDTLDMRTQTWRTHDFSAYDVVYHVAGIAHADVGQVTEEEKKQYYRVNTDLAVETAEKAKKEEARLAEEKAAAERAEAEAKAMANTRLLEEIRDLLKQR